MQAHKTLNAQNTAQAYIDLLETMGVKYFLGAAGTDFASIVDAFAKRATEGRNTPKPLLIPHESCAVSMAHGYFLITGDPLVVMVHTTPGTTNAMGNLLNARRSNVPIIMTAGRTPITEQGMIGSRDGFIHWGQEFFDQGSMVREIVKWDYELRNSAQLETMVRRAFQVAMTEPKGPVYFTLPREVLAEPCEKFTISSEGPEQTASTPAADANAIEKTAALIANSQRPLIITRAVGVNPNAVGALAKLADSFAIPVIEYPFPAYVNFPFSHPMHLGYMPGKLLSEADLILVIECDVPWTPHRQHLRPEAKVVHIGVDPIYQRYPIWGFQADLAIQADALSAINSLIAALESRRKPLESAIASRHARLTKEHDTQRGVWREQGIESGKNKELTFDWISYCLGQVKDDSTIFVNEYDMSLPQMGLDRPGSYFGTSTAGHLGWSLGAALGIKLASPTKTVVTVIGDGSYLFNTPGACHMVSVTNNLPILTIVTNNGGWGAVKSSTLGVHPEGWASRTDNYPMARFETEVAYEKFVQAYGGHGEAVKNPAEFRDALERGLRIVREERRPVVINAICKRI